MTATNVDHIAVQRVLEGDRTITLNDDEREAVIIAAYHQHLSDSTTALMVRCHANKVREAGDRAGLPRRTNGAHLLDAGWVA